MNPKLYILCERDAGLFSLIQQVIAHIPAAVATGRIPIVCFGRRCAYYVDAGYQGRDTVWEYYFEPLVDGFPAAAIPAAVASAIDRSPPDPRQSGREEDGGFFVTNNFGGHRELTGLTLEIPCLWDDPGPELRAVTAPLIEQYIRPRAYILEKVERFYHDKMSRTPMIGVHMRGTDRVSGADIHASRIGSLRPDAYAAALERLLVETPDAGIFVATDAESSLDFMRAQFPGRVVAYDSIRHRSGKAAGRGPMGGLIPGYIAGSPETAAQNGEQAIIEYLLLRRCRRLVHNGSNLARTVLLAEPAMLHINTNHHRNRFLARVRAFRPIKLIWMARDIRNRLLYPRDARAVRQ